MAFFRIKKIKGNEYLYLVENEWKRKTSRQKVTCYLGKIHRFEKANDADFLSFRKIENIELYVQSNSYEKTIKDLVEWEISQLKIGNDFSVDFENISATIKNKRAVVAIKNGFLCDMILKNLIKFQKEDEETDGKRLARCFIESGIDIPQELFIAIFNKMHPHKN